MEVPNGNPGPIHQTICSSIYTCNCYRISKLLPIYLIFFTNLKVNNSTKLTVMLATLKIDSNQGGPTLDKILQQLTSFGKILASFQILILLMILSLLTILASRDESICKILEYL